jgi:tape measure domain-containing protein
MANEQILTIKLNVDTTNVKNLTDANKKIEDSFKSVTTSSNELTDIEQKRIAITNQQYLAQAQLLTSMAHLNEISKQGGTIASIAFNQATAEIKKYNAELDKARLLAAASGAFGVPLASAISRGYIASNKATSNTPTALQGSFSGVAGLSQQPILANAKALEELTKQQKTSALVTKEHEEVHRGLILRIVEGVSIYKLYNASINLVWNSLKAIPQIGIELDSTRASLLATIGSSAGAESALSALRSEALRTGIQITALRESFRGFQASTSLAGVSLESTWKMFTNLDTVITGLHLSTDKANGIFLAMAQIFNKGKVQSEELVKQLGNLLPGAFSSMAASMGISTIELSKQMKKGMVYAQDVMENFTDYMKNRFAPAFAAASEGLNANIGRMKNSFTNLGEVVYAEVSPTLLSIVKGITSITNSFTDLVTHFDTIKTSLAVLTNIGFSALIISITKYIGAISLAGKGTFAFGETIATAIQSMKFTEIASVSLTGVLTTLRGLFMTLLPIAIVTGIVIGAEKLYEVFTKVDNLAKQSSEGLRAYLDERDRLLTKAAGGPKGLEIKVDEDEGVRALKAKIASEEATLQDLKYADTGTSKARQDVRNAALKESEKALDIYNRALFDQRNKVREDLQKQIQDEKQLRSEGLTKTLEDINANLADYSEKEANTAAGAAKKAYDKFIHDQQTNLSKLKSDADAINREIASSGKQATPEQGQELARIEETRLKVLNAAKEKQQEVYATKAKTIADKAETEASRIRADAYSNLERDNKNEVKANEDKLIDLDNGYKNNVISISDYYAKRNAIISANRDINKQNLGAELNIAVAGGKQAEIDKVKDKQIEANRAIAAEERQTFNARSNDEQKLSDLASKLIAERLTQEGEVEQAAIASFNVRHKAEIDLATANLNSSNAEVANNARVILSEEKLLSTYETLNKYFKAAETEKSKGEASYNAAVSKTNSLAQLGVIGQLQSFKELDAAREKQLEILQKTIDTEEKALAASNLSSDKALIHQEILDKTKTQFQLLKEEGSALGRHFETALGGSFDTAFTSMIMGTSKAGDAFKSFGVSVVKTIADIIAQEVRSAILRPLVSSAFSGISGLFSSGASAASSTTSYGSSGNSASFSSLISGAFANPKVLGGVSSAPGLSALSGTVLHSPTIIPFATGGALAGEAGPEAIMPLSRDPSTGKLGVKANGSNSGQSGGNVYNISVAVQAVKDESPTQTGNRVAEAMMTSIAQREIANANRVGNQSNRITSFG